MEDKIISLIYSFQPDFQGRTSIVFLVIIYSIGLQLLIIFSLIIYIFIHRLLSSKYDKNKKLKFDEWYELIFSYLDGDSSGHEFKDKIHKRDYRIFGDFIKEFFLDIEGDDKRRLLNLLVAVDFPDYLFRLMSNRNQWERAFAIYFLGLILYKEKIDLIRKRIFDKSETVSFMAATVLMQLKDAQSIPLIINKLTRDQTKDIRIRLTNILLQYGKDILPEIVPVFRSPDSNTQVKLVCIDIFKNYTHYEVTQDLISLYEITDDRELKIACISTLGIFEDPTLIDFFEAQLSHGNKVVKSLAAKSLGVFGEPSSLEKLIPLLDHTDFWIIKNTTDAIFEYGPEGLEILNHKLKNPSSILLKNIIKEKLNIL
ncbi:MAG: HEAT repeat domain-containing protein [Deltaproteobacteria bacterium]|nr:HEAT repeat domain-containing protein [Deltaproteobacteria bacterium]